jgi:hypothetical protein
LLAGREELSEKYAGDDSPEVLASKRIIAYFIKWTDKKFN